MKKQQEELALLEKQKKEEQNKERLDKVRHNIEDIQRRMNSRDQETKQWKETLKNLYKHAPNPDGDFKKKEEEKYKKTFDEKRAELKERAKPIDPLLIKAHEAKYLEEKNKKKEEKEKEIKEKLRNEKIKKPEFVSNFYKKADEELIAKAKQEEERKRIMEEKRKKLEELENLRKEKFLPKIDEEKREQLERDYEKLKHIKIKRYSFK